MKILIADDEKSARKKIISFLESLEPDDELIEAENGIDAVENILNEKPELVFLDIQMPGLTGFDVIREVGIDKMPAVVFITAYDQYAIDAFEVNAIDYLLKPFDNERFIKSFNRAVEQITLTKNKNESIKNLLKEIVQDKKTVEKLLVNIGARYFFVNTHEIIYISSAEKYVELNTAKGKYLYRETMNNLESALDKNKFTRIHRSYIVNVDYIQEMQPWSHGDFVILLKNGEKISMSRRYRDNLFNEKVAE